ncbi:MAG: adenosylcobinamide-GDP ribazoletransferase [Rhizobacter sp.]
MRGLVTAFAFLTRVPMPRVTIGAREQAASLKWYPFVGLVLGVMLGALALLMQAWTPLPGAALLLVVWVALTGALHLDGLADSADAWIGGMGDRERTLAIMKDPRSGPAGVVALVLVLLLKFSALASLADPLLLVLPPLLGRAASVGLFLTTPYVREGGLGSALRGAPANGCRIALVATLVVALCFGTRGMAAVAIALVIGACWRRACLHRLGGFTGDTAGALVEMIEAGSLFALLATH